MVDLFCLRLCSFCPGLKQSAVENFRWLMWDVEWDFTPYDDDDSTFPKTREEMK